MLVNGEYASSNLKCYQKSIAYIVYSRWHVILIWCLSHPDHTQNLKSEVIWTWHRSTGLQVMDKDLIGVHCKLRWVIILYQGYTIALSLELSRAALLNGCIVLMMPNLSPVEAYSVDRKTATSTQISHCWAQWCRQCTTSLCTWRNVLMGGIFSTINKPLNLLLCTVYEIINYSYVSMNNLRVLF